MKSLRNTILQEIVTEIENECMKVEIAQKSKHGIKTRIMEKHQVSQPWISRDIIDHYQHNNKNYLMTQTLVFLAIPANNIRPIELSSLSSNSSTLSKQGGRPKGITIESTRDLQARTIEANNFAAEEFERAQLQRRQDGKKQVSKGVYDEIIDEASAMFNLSDTIVLSKETA